MAADVSRPMARLSGYVATALSRPLPAEVAERACIHLVDTFAAIVAGSRLLPGTTAAGYVAGLAGRREAGVIGTGVLTSAAYAALANGMSAHADETDDTHPPTRSHPGSAVVPATLAVCERDRIDGKTFLRAVVLGWDVCARTLLALAPKPVSSTYGHLFGAAAACAALTRLDEGRIRHVLAYAGQQASGLYTRLRDSRHVEKAFAVGGMPARNGVECATMVAAGFSGVDDVFSGQHNIIATFSPEGDPRALARGLGSRYEILRGGIKCWSAGGPIQGPLHVLHEMIARHGLTVDRVEKIVARLPDKELALVDGRRMPDISIRHLLALMLVDGGLTFASTHDADRMKDPRVVAAARRIETVGDARLTDPLRRWRCEMEVVLRDGKVLRHRTMAAKGTSVNPITRAEGEAKAIDLMAPVLGDARARELIAALHRIDRVKDARELRPLYAARPKRR